LSIRPIGVCQTMRPEKSKAARPCVPNDAYTSSPSVVGVAETLLFFG
jgi:hypothetical protein